MASKPPSRTPLAGGFLLAISLMLGTIIGAIQGQPSLGLVIGFGVGIVLIAATWAYERKRGR